MNLNIKVFISTFLIIFMISGCASQDSATNQSPEGISPPGKSEVEMLMDYANITNYTRDVDPGLVLGIKGSPILNQSVIKYDINFTVHQVIADAIRTLLIFSYELPDSMINDKDNDRDDNPDPFRSSARRYEMVTIDGLASYSIQRKYTDGQHVTGIAYFAPLSRETEMITVTSENLGGIINATWSVEVPVTFMEDIQGKDRISHKMLKTEKDGLEFKVIDLTLGSTATSVDWTFKKLPSYEGKPDYTIVRTHSFDQRFFPNIPFGVFGGFPEFILKRPWQNVYLKDEQDNLITSFATDHTETKAFFPPMDSEQEFKVLLTDVLLQNNNPVNLHLKKESDGWRSSHYSKAGTTVTLKEVILGEKTLIKLHYQYGRLGEMMEPYLLDGSENRYQLEEMELQIPAYNELMADLEVINSIISTYEGENNHKFVNKYRQIINQFVDDFQKHDKYQILYFPALTDDVDELTLVFNKVVYLYYQDWEIDIR